MSDSQFIIAGNYLHSSSVALRAFDAEEVELAFDVEALERLAVSIGQAEAAKPTLELEISADAARPRRLALSGHRL